MRQIDGMRKSEVQDGASRRLAMAQATVDANARGARRVVCAAFAGREEGGRGARGGGGGELIKSGRTRLGKRMPVSRRNAV